MELVKKTTAHPHSENPSREDERREHLEIMLAALRKQTDEDSLRNYRRFQPRPRKTSRTGNRK